jgi:protein-L-isoaspartate(D-aspartate) O-methyltransferase
VARALSAGDELAAALAPHVADPRVLDAIRAVPRDRFVVAAQQRRAWANEALPIADGQTISQPLVVARMCELLELRGDERVLDVGTGSGYHAAVLARLAAEVHGIEIRESLVETARAALAAAGVANVVVHPGDGRAGLPQHAPFDAVNVAAAGPPGQLETLCTQLAPGGRLVAPIEEGRRQRLVLLRSVEGGRIDRSDHERVRFVPLMG